MRTTHINWLKSLLEHLNMTETHTCTTPNDGPYITTHIHIDMQLDTRLSQANDRALDTESMY